MPQYNDPSLPLSPGAVAQLPYGYDGYAPGTTVRIVQGPSGDGCYQVEPVSGPRHQVFWAHVSNIDWDRFRNAWDIARGLARS